MTTGKNHYDTLGVPEKATPEEIKTAYRKLASQHHPDKGGDTAKFQEIQTAYNTISDPNQRQQYDMERAGHGRGGFRFNVNGVDMGMGPDINDILRQHGFSFGNGGVDPFTIFGQRQQQRRNKDLQIQIPLQLADTLQEQSKTIEVKTTNGHKETIEVKIPRGVTNGASIRYSNLGDNFFSTLPRGDLYIHFAVQMPSGFFIHGPDLVTEYTIDCLTAITGSEINITGIDGKVFNLVIPAGTQPNALLRIKGQGIFNVNNPERSNLIVKINVTVPKNVTPEQVEIINQLKKSL